MAGTDPIDPATTQWQEMFSTQVARDFEHNREILDEIRALVKAQNSQVKANTAAIATRADEKDCQANALDIARLKTWVPLVGGAATVGSLIATAVVQLLMR